VVYSIGLLTLLCGFYSAYFAKQLSLKKQGVDTNRLAKGEKPSSTRRIEKALFASTYVTAVLQFLSVFFSSYMGGFSLPAAVRIAGICVAFCGVLFFLLAIVTMRKNWRAGVDKTQKTEMVTTGIYRVSRNPAFAAFDLLYLGTVLVFPNMLMVAAAIVTALLLHLQILEEEKYLSLTFGDAYLVYKKKTARYFFF